MKKILLLGLFGLTVSVASSQVLKRLGDRAKNKMEQKAGQKVDKTIDDATDGQPNKEKTGGDDETKIKNEDGSKTKTGDESVRETAFNSKYDFVSGEKIMGFEDFSATTVGDFPTRWNTNATAEVVTLNNKEGKWLKINKEGVFLPEFINNLPENFTLEFDLAVNNGWYSSPFALNIANLKRPEDFTRYNHYVQWSGDHAIHMDLKPTIVSNRVPGNSAIKAAKDGNYTINNNVDFKVWDNGNNNFAHVSLWRQKQRLRVYVNGEKIWDLPRAFDATSQYNAITFAMQGSYKGDDYFLLGNIRLAIGAADTRNKLITEGKWSTSGILFDTNSDKIKPNSYGTLKEIATVLTENPDLRVKIIGHTDADGDDKANMDLSKKRAASVKTSLTEDFKIDASRLDTDGMGETKPLADNTTPEGKAQNRRVEFVKI